MVNGNHGDHPDNYLLVGVAVLLAVVSVRYTVVEESRIIL